MRSLLMLRRPDVGDEVVVRQAQAELVADGFEFAYGLGPEITWADFLRHLELLHEGTNPPEGFMPATYYLAEVDGEVVGSTSLRYQMNEYLTAFGGHIGYCVRPEFRRRGYAVEILRQQVRNAHEAGLTDVLVTCLDSNVASAAVIVRGGGVFEELRTRPDGAIFRRYWISTTL